jgi:hypothetical protein
MQVGKILNLRFSNAYVLKWFLKVAGFLTLALTTRVALRKDFSPPNVLLIL